MYQKHIDILCRQCGLPLVVEDRQGNLSWGRHEKWCAARYPTGESPGRKAAKAKLVCGDACQHPESSLHDLGDVAHCGKCPHQRLANAAVNTNVKSSGGQKPTEIILPSSRRKFPKAVPLSLYTDALVRIDELEKMLKRRGG